MNEQQTPLFSLAYTSVRPGFIAPVVALWNERSCLGDLEWVIAVDEGDADCLAAAQAVAETSRYPVKVVINHGSRDCCGGWNCAAAATQGKVLIAVADDFVPPADWDRLLLELPPQGWQNGEHVVHVNDGYVRTLCTLPILTRRRYERFGYLYYPKYRSMFADTEFTEVAYRDRVMIEAMHLLFEHKHPDCGKRLRDAVDLTHASQERWNMGEMLFNFRKARGFPLDDGPKAGQADAVQATVNENFAAYMQVIQSDFCLFETCQRLFEEGVRDFFWAEPDAYWSGEPVALAEKEELAAVAGRVEALGAKIRRKTFAVADYRLAGDSRIVVETRLRNDSLAWVRAEGFQHILVVDGDELWMRGTLSILEPHVRQGCCALACCMVPAIGLPSYPVEGALDIAVVYLGPGMVFHSCRTPVVEPLVIKIPRIFHFTGTRKTQEEIVKKHRRSGHYDDPDYDFEGWLRDVLPNIRPGFAKEWRPGNVGVHMYLPRQIWPAIRHWRAEEWQEMPEALKPYLGCPPD